MSRHRKSKRRMRLSSRILLFSAIVFLVAAVALLGYSLHKRAQDRKILEQEDHQRDLFQGTACEITERACSLFPAASGLAVETSALGNFSRQSAAARRTAPQRQGFADTTRQSQYPGYVLQLGSRDPG